VRDRSPEHSRSVGATARGRTYIDDAQLLARKARPFLQGYGSSERQIQKWADTYVDRMGSVDVKSFVEWIHLRQRVREVT